MTVTSWPPAVRNPGTGRAAVSAAAACGVVMLALPALAAPAVAQAVTALGALAAAAGLSRRWVPARTVAAAAAVTQCVVAQPATMLIAADGLLMLGYLLFAGAPRHLPPQAARRWLGAQVPFLLAAIPVSGVILAVLTLPAASSAWIAVAGVAAAAAAYVVALPRRPPPPS